MRRKYIGDRSFYKMALTVAMPIMLQNFITNLVSMLDNLMVGALGTEQMSGVSIVNQILFVFNLCIFGGLSGIGIFTSQFYGKNDDEGIRYTLRMKLIIAVLITAAAMLLFTFYDDFFINLFLHEVDDSGDIALTLSFAKEYFRVILAGLVPFALSQILASTLRETGNTFTPMTAGLAAVVINGVFNYLLIFGKAGFPELGVTGAAIATVMSRFAEFVIQACYIFVKRAKYTYINGAFRSLKVPGKLFVSILAKGMPLLVNELLWSGGMTALSVAYSLHGISVVAAISIATSVINLFNIAFLSLGSSIGIIAGKSLGAGRHEEAVDNVRKMIALSLSVSVCVGVALYFTSGAIVNLFKTGEESKRLALYFIRVCSFVMPLNAFSNASYFTLRSGGKTIITFAFDSGILWLVSVPLAFSLYYVAGLPVKVIFPVIQFAEIIKVIVGFILLRKRVWVKTIV
ncbi:multidrug resistance protein NorM [Thermoclostridium stercorarium subsp. stercorarium DSM 8532]|uniref:Probable multidrug resistance protein NorM n=3 Tax=Thermoclostridium stercorarium TaxID=1510 RepID=L7VQ83_THES1|nr:MATE family efflux transporter [Thermoclostridium stercorarium]AGC68962.1 multidrug resistance protein NorM [Thermoclostridium stercorarium subsp. stercorarium DSM 8532]AGI39943.1 efflux protein [Thermoclostridium stercorarium subsp. stercorarium DSM 8532]ANW99264.1 MATE family efflux transporter [Thermoclostridium stercorarium subsp. thermolacticum DSM 2910]ANX01892.1 MATE family efflux transporter [Thermoclostridium stercorarium subsp. leptospartum DSM 9219]UZQ84937.1 MATE family efflux t